MSWHEAQQRVLAQDLHFTVYGPLDAAEIHCHRPPVVRTQGRMGKSEFVVCVGMVAGCMSLFGGTWNLMEALDVKARICKG